MEIATEIAVVSQCGEALGAPRMVNTHPEHHLRALLNNSVQQIHEANNETALGVPPAG